MPSSHQSANDVAESSAQTAARGSLGFVVVWAESTSSSNDIRARMFDVDGAPLSAALSVNASSAGDEVLPSVAGFANGGFVVTWTDNNGATGDSSSAALLAQVFDSTGQKVGGEVLVNTSTAGRQTEADVIALSDGGFLSPGRISNSR